MSLRRRGRELNPPGEGERKFCVVLASCALPFREITAELCAFYFAQGTGV